MIDVAFSYFGEEAYEWDAFEIKMDPQTQRFYWSIQGGCSCNDFESPATLGEYHDGGILEVIAVVRGLGMNPDKRDSIIRDIEAAVK